MKFSSFCHMKALKIQNSRICKNTGMLKQMFSPFSFLKTILQLEFHFAAHTIYLRGITMKRLPRTLTSSWWKKWCKCSQNAIVTSSATFAFQNFPKSSLLHCSEDHKSHSERRTGGRGEKVGPGEVTASFLSSLLLCHWCLALRVSADFQLSWLTSFTSQITPDPPPQRSYHSLFLRSRAAFVASQIARDGNCTSRWIWPRENTL